MVSTPSAPAAPDPAATAAAQAKSNKETAVAQYGLNATNQVTPQGTLSYKQIGTWDDGTPRFESTQALSQGEQQLYDKGNVTRNNLADIANTSSAQIGQLLNTPLDLDKATGDKIQSIQNSFLDPQWQKQGAALETDLINRGLRPGTEAYNNAKTAFSQQRQSAYDQSYLDSYKTAQGAALQQRNQPINEISALMSGSQVSTPSWLNQTNVGVAPTDVIGAQQQSLNQQNVVYNAQVQNQQALTNGLFKLGSAAAGGWAMSDIETKEDIEVVGERPDGLHVIDFNYKPGIGEDTAPRHRGLIAQEVAQVYPHAAARQPARGGLLAVNYDAVPGSRGLMGLGAKAA